MGKLVRNTAINPAEEKFKRIKLSNSKVKSAIVDSTGGLLSLLAMGWVYDEADKEHLVLPKGKNMTMKEVGVMCLPSRKLLRTIDHQRSDNAGMQFVHTVQLDLSRHAHNLADGNHKVKRYSGQKFVTALCRFELLKIPKTD